MTAGRVNSFKEHALLIEEVNELVKAKGYSMNGYQCLENGDIVINLKAHPRSVYDEEWVSKYAWV